MSVEFRQRTPGEYGRMVWRRKWVILLPAAAVALAVGWVVVKLPNVYESTTLLTVRPPSINTTAVPQLSDSDLTIRINNIRQEVTSRSSLEPLIERYGLYAAERHRGTPMDELVERMRLRDINVLLNTTRNDITNGFYLSFRGPDPRTTQAVTAELATKYVNAQTSAATNESAQTKQFFEERLRQAKEELDSIDRQRLAYMMQNVQTLPTSSQPLVQRLTGLYEQQKSYMTEIGRLREQLASANNLLGDVSKQSAQEKDDVIETVTDPKTTLAYAELAKKKGQLESELQNLLATFKPKHPDVIAKRAELGSVQEEIDRMIADWKARVAEKQERIKNRVDPRVYTLRNNIETGERMLLQQEALLRQTNAQIADLERRLNGVPNTEVALSAMDREYQSKKVIHDELLAQKGKADMVADVQATAQGETIAVIDPAYLPERPVAPNRMMLIVLGLFAGLGCGLLFAAFFEVPRLLTVQTREDAEHYTGLPVLASLPNLLTPREERRLKLRRAAFAVAGVAAAVLSVPALYVLLKFTNLIETIAMRG